MALTDEPWFWWSIGLIVGAPVLLIVLSEIHARLVRRRSALARPVGLLRTWLLPVVALWVLLTQASEVSTENRGVRIVATIMGVLALFIVLAAINAVLFAEAEQGSWRERMPSIFVEIARLVLVVLGAALVASFVWGANVGGLFAALGVTTIVIGFALQNAVGSIVSGLLLLFEQPFQLGDRIEVGGVVGKVVEVNWRACHLDIGGGLQIVPNATLAAASFKNLSRPTIAHDASVTTTFAVSDPPHHVSATLLEVAGGLPYLRRDSAPGVRLVGAGSFEVTLPLRTAADTSAATSMFLTWLWYAARRDEIHLDGEPLPHVMNERVVEAVRSVGTTLRLREDEVEIVAAECEIEVYGRGEYLLHEGDVPIRLAFILEGAVEVSATAPSGARIPVLEQTVGEYVGPTVLLREATQLSWTASTEVTVLQVSRRILDQLVERKPALARDFNEVIEERRDLARRAIELAGAGVVAVDTRPVRTGFFRR